ncbi:MAG: DUF6352 family protein [Fimbriimonadaceae bacterium]|nr:DUF6352 family protein [Alphaproteobacteria bacterium]
MARDFWKSAGMHLLERNADGWLTVTPDYLRAYYTRPEIHPVEESCKSEHALFNALMADPFRAVEEREISGIIDDDTRANYRVVLDFRDILIRHKTLEAAYLAMMKASDIRIPPLFIDQMVHIILRNMLRDCDDPVRLRAAEILFRDQNVNVGDGRVMFADEEIVSMHAETGGLGGIGQLLVESNTPVRSVELDVLDDDNKHIYWQRSDRFDTVIDLRFTQPGLDALARVLEAWVRHFLRVEARILPMQSVKDERWSWHIGLDLESTWILNALYEGKDVAPSDLEQIVALFKLEFRDPEITVPTMRHKPVYLGLAMSQAGLVKMKPQNLLINLPLAGAAS